jgi:hypothetical protein
MILVNLMKRLSIQVVWLLLLATTMIAKCAILAEKILADAAVTNGMAYSEYLDAWAGGNFTISATAALIGTVVEIY